MMVRWQIAACLICSALVSAQGIFETADGRRVEGRLEGRGPKSTLITGIGPFRGPSPVLLEGAYERQTDEWSQAQTTLVGADVSAWRAAGSRCLESGYWTGLFQVLDHLLLRDVDDPWAGPVVAELARLVKLDPAAEESNARIPRRSVRRLFEAFPERGPLAAALAAEQLRSWPETSVVGEALDALESREPRQRWVAARVLALARNSPQRVRPLLAHAVRDGSADVRVAASRALGVTGDDVFVRILARSLEHPHSGVRAQAGEALGHLGHPAAIPYLIAALEGVGGTRSNITVRTQKAYIRDFDVEIAQGAVIADPIVDVVSEGTILDVRVAGISVERGAYRGALRRLVGSDEGDDPSAWRRRVEARDGDAAAK